MLEFLQIVKPVHSIASPSQMLKKVKTQIKKKIYIIGHSNNTLHFFGRYKPPYVSFCDIARSSPLLNGPLLQTRQLWLAATPFAVLESFFCCLNCQNFYKFAIHKTTRKMDKTGKVTQHLVVRVINFVYFVALSYAELILSR